MQYDITVKKGLNIRVSQRNIIFPERRSAPIVQQTTDLQTNIDAVGRRQISIGRLILDLSRSSTRQILIQKILTVEDHPQQLAQTNGVLSNRYA